MKSLQGRLSFYSLLNVTTTSLAGKINSKISETIHCFAIYFKLLTLKRGDST